MKEASGHKDETLARGDEPGPACAAGMRGRRLAFRLDRAAHRAFAAGDEPIAAEGVDLVAFEFRMFHRGRQTNGTARSIDFPRQFIALFRRMTEEILHHPNDIVVRMIVIIPQDDVVPGLLLGPLVATSLGLLDRLVLKIRIRLGGRGIRHEENNALVLVSAAPRVVACERL